MAVGILRGMGKRFACALALGLALLCALAAMTACPRAASAAATGPATQGKGVATLNASVFCPGTYTVRTSLVKEGDDAASMAAKAFGSSAELVVASDGSASLQLSVSKLSAGSITAYPDDIKILQGTSFGADAVDAEELDPYIVEADGATYSVPSAIKFDIPAASFDGPYIYMQLAARGAPGMGVQPVRLKVTYGQIAVVDLVRGGYTYTGKAIKAGVRVSGSDYKVLSEGSDYSVSYKSNVKPGTAVVTVTGKGEYQGSMSESFIIFAKVAAAPKLSVGKKKITVKKWAATGAGRYQVQYRVKGGAWKVGKTVASPKKVTVSKLRSGKKYQVRIVSIAGSGKVCGKMSAFKKVK